MTLHYTLGGEYEAFVRAQMASGYYRDANEVVSAALRMMEDHIQYQSPDVQTAIHRGLAQARAGELLPLNHVVSTLHAELRALPDIQT